MNSWHRRLLSSVPPSKVFAERRFGYNEVSLADVKRDIGGGRKWPLMIPRYRLNDQRPLLIGLPGDKRGPQN